MIGTPEQFNVDLTAHAARMGEKADLFVKGFVQTLFNEVQSGGKFSPGTPIRTGFHRASWHGGIGATQPVSLTPGQPNYAAELAESQAKLEAVALAAKAGDVVVFENNGPAIVKLEQGSSQQAPAGMVGLAVNAAPLIADEVAKHVFGMP